MKHEKLSAAGRDIYVFTEDYQSVFVSLTNIARIKSDNPKDAIKNWIRSKDTISLLTFWETIHNSEEFDAIAALALKDEAGTNAFTLSPQRWVDETKAKGIVVKSGRNGGTYAHTDIAYDFAAWISPEIRLIITSELTKLTQGDGKLSREWNKDRKLSSLSYRVHTDAVKECLVCDESSEHEIREQYMTEADMLNMVLFNTTASRWKKAHPNEKGNMRDHASCVDLIILSNIQAINASMIRDGRSMWERYNSLKDSAAQMRLSYGRNMKGLESLAPFDV